jgi:hypothetical protein
LDKSALDRSCPFRSAPGPNLSIAKPYGTTV